MKSIFICKERTKLGDPIQIIKCLAFNPSSFFDDFKLKTASKHPFLKQAIHFSFLNSYLESNHKIF
jgi:hypothetical protein